MLKFAFTLERKSMKFGAEKHTTKKILMVNVLASFIFLEFYCKE